VCVCVRKPSALTTEALTLRLRQSTRLHSEEADFGERRLWPTRPHMSSWDITVSSAIDRRASPNYSSAHEFHCRCFVHGDVIGLVIFDFKLKVIIGRMMDVALSFASFVCTLTILPIT
jgi:hypothetical protein